MAKLMDRMRGGTHGGWTIADVRTLCAQEEFECSPPSDDESYWKISHPLSDEILTMPAHRPIKPICLQNLVDMIQAVRKIQFKTVRKRRK